MNSEDISDHQLHLLHHTLGVRPDMRNPYRNHFVASEGHHDMPDLKVLEAFGLMARSPTPKFCDADAIVFHVTEAGRAYALEHLPQPPKRSRYEQYLDADSSLTFAEWLGIEVPEREYQGRWWTRDRMVRLKSSRATGGWAKTIKDAKASYKEALKQAGQANNNLA
jgi:hypothetical protein